MYSCKKDIQEKENTVIQEEIPTGPGGGGGSTSCVETLQNGFDTVEAQTVLGFRLQNNPYSVAVMQQAALNLYGHTNGIAVNKLYVRVRPSGIDQLELLENLNIPLFDYPLDYEVVKEGDYYQQGNGPEDMPWFYTVVDANFIPPSGIQYEILEQVYIPNYNLLLEAEAFRITGNPLNNLCDGGTDYRLPNPCDPNDPNCMDSGGGGTGGGGVNTTRPQGAIRVFDINLMDARPLRRAMVVAKNFLKIVTVYTDDAGRFTCTKNFNKVTITVKFKNNHAQIKGLRGARLWQLFFPVEANLGRFRGELNNIDRTIFRNDEVRSRGMRHWVAATVHNNVLEFSDMANPDELFLPNNQIKIFISPGASAASAPMFVQRGPVIPEIHKLYFFRKFIANLSLGNFALYYYSCVPSHLSRLVDIVFGYNKVLELLDSDDISETIFHELVHAAHYAKVGGDWWHNFVNSELIEGANNDGTDWDTYGHGNTERSPIIALGESWAYHYGRILANTKYAASSSRQFEQGFDYRNGTIWQFGTQVAITGLNAHLNLLEDFDPGRTNDPYFWIPQGLFNDLADNRNDNNVVNPRVLLDDNVIGYTNQQFFNALDNDINSLPNYRIRLLQENAPNNQAPGVATIFTFYGY